MANKIDTERALRLAGEYLVGKAKENLASGKLNHPTGVLLNSVEYWIEDGDTLCVGTKLGYGAFVELGTGLFAINGDGRKDVPWRYQDEQGRWWTTSGQHPKPWLRPALEDNKNKITQLISNNLEINK